jgi:signal transduction histidine kinase
VAEHSVAEHSVDERPVGERPVGERVQPGGRLRNMLGQVTSLGRVAKTVRGRSVVSNVAAVVVTSVVGAIVLLLLFRSSLQRNLDQTLQLQAQDRVGLIENGTDPATLVGPQQQEAFVWIGTPDGQTVATGGSLVPLETPLPSDLNGVSDLTMRVEEISPTEVETERMTLRVAAASTRDGSLVVVAGSENEAIGKTVRQLATLFAFAVPLLALVVGALSWRTAGRALAPVEEIRRRATAVTGARLSQRVPVPDTGDEIEQLAETMNAMLGRLELHRDSLRQFTSDASHELKSPVANLRALLDTTTSSDPGWPESRTRLVAETDRLKSLVENLLYLASHAETGAIESPALVHIDDLLFDEAEMVASAQQVKVDISGVGPADVMGDAADLRRLFRNLVDNAARYASSTVTLSVETISAVALSVETTNASTGVTVVRVVDDGPGIPVADRARVFDRFTRLDAARDRELGGSGLGLAIARQIVDDHRGSIMIEEADGGGTAVVLKFPG